MGTPRSIIQRKRSEKLDVQALKLKGTVEEPEVEKKDLQIKGLHIDLKKHRLYNMQQKEEVGLLKEDISMLSISKRKSMGHTDSQGVVRKAKGKKKEMLQKNLKKWFS